MNHNLDNNEENTIVEETKTEISTSEDTSTEAVIEATSPETVSYEDPNLNCEPKIATNDNYSYNTSTNNGYNQLNSDETDNSPMSMGDWLLTILVMTLLPCVGIPMYFVWAFSKNGNVNRRNYCRAYLIIAGISLVLAVIAMIFIGISMIGSYGSLDYYF